MKKILKSCLLVLVAVCLCFSAVGCKKKISATSVDTSNVASVDNKTTNGGMTVVYGEYLYFINGTKTNDGTSLSKNKRSAICRIKYNAETGETTGDAEVVVDELVGYEDGSLNFFGDYMYYATPCAEKNYKSEVLYNKTCFKRYDLVHKKSYTIYTTAKNDSEETVSYAYYVVGNELELVVYETENATITSLKIDSKVKTNYVISDVTGCLFSETYGKSAGESVDANNFVFYTKSPETYDAVQTGVKVYKTLPNQNSSVLISEGKSITLKTVRAGKLVYKYGDFIYASLITASANDRLETNNLNCISRVDLENAIYIENYTLEGKDTTAKLVKAQGHICVLYFDSDNKYFVIFEWTDTANPIEDNCTIITHIDEANSFAFLGTTYLEEVVTEDDPDTDENEEVKRTVLYAIFKNSSLVYKIEIGEVTSETEIKVTLHADQVKLSTTTISDAVGNIVPEIIGKFAFVLAEDSDKNKYIYKIDLTPTETVTKDATVVQVKE